MNCKQRASMVVALSLLLPFAAQSQDVRTPAADPETSQVRVTEPGGIREGLGVPRLIKFGGALRTPSGNALTGVHGVTLAVYKDRQGGAPLWLESQNVELDDLGRYTVLLGATKNDGVPLDLFASDEPRWLGIQVQLPGYQEEPRALMVSVPYAMKAAEAETLGGLPLSSFVLTPEAARKAGLGAGNSGREGGERGLTAGTTLPVAAVSGTGTTNQVPKWLDAIGTLGDSTISDTGTAVGIGTPSPDAPLHIKVSGTFDNVLKIQGINQTDGLGLKLTHPNAVIGFALAGGTGHFFPTAVEGDALIFAQPGKNLLIGVGSENMRLNSTGNLGLGITSPTGKLHIKARDESSTGVLVMTARQSTNAWDFALDSATTPNLWLQYNGSNPPNMFWGSSGNVGIGTSSPSQKLDVSGNINSSGAVTATSFSGDGSALTALNASNVGSGTIANSRTTADSANTASAIVARDGSGNFSAGAITATSFSGSGASLTSLNGSNISSGTVANARTTATSSNTASAIVARDSSGRFNASAITLLDTSATAFYSSASSTAANIHAIRGDAPVGNIAILGWAGGTSISDVDGDAGVVGLNTSATGQGVLGSNTTGTGVFGSSTSGNGVEGSSTSGLAGKFTGNVQVTGKLSVGVPPASDTVALVNQTAAIGSTTIYTTPAAIGQYRVSVYAFTSAAGDAVNLTFTIGWTDPTTTAKSKTSATIPIDTLGGYDQAVFTLVSGASTTITYSTSLTGGVGAGTYDIYIKLEKL